METDQVTSENELHSVMKNIDGEISRLQTLIAGEDDKMLRYKVSFGVWLTCARLSEKGVAKVKRVSSGKRSDNAIRKYYNQPVQNVVCNKVDLHGNRTVQS